MGSGIKYLNSLKRWVGEKDFSLERILLISAELGNPHNSFRSIHVAGSNGKGSVSVTLASILNASGLKVGLTISPHVVDITERIVIDGQQISEETLNTVCNEVREACEIRSIELSQFEALTLCAFLIFREQKVDIAIVEVGLGGRLDATNIISKPDITAIVSISDDHKEILGSTLPEIAKEKAGIIKNDVPCVIGNVSTEVYLAIKEIAVKNVAELICLGEEFNCISHNQGVNRASYLYSEAHSNFKLPLESNLLGDHQANNIGVAVKISRMLKIPSNHIQEGVSRVTWPCRLEFCYLNHLELIFDCAHNTAGICSLFKYLTENNINLDCMVFGAINSKNWKEMILELAPIIKQWFIIEPRSEQAVSSSEIEKFISDHALGLTRSFAKNYGELAAHILNFPRASKILIAGSIYMIGALRAELGIELKPLWNEVDPNLEHHVINSRVIGSQFS